MSYELRLKKNFSDNDIKTACQYAASTCFSYSSWRKASILASVFTKRSSCIDFDSNFNGMAAIDVDNRRIKVNYEVAGQVLGNAVPFFLSHLDFFPFLKGRDYWNRWEVFNFDAYAEYFSCYLILHEIGHYLYTVSPDRVREISKDIAMQKHIPFSFIFYCVNVVEDSFIQQRLQLDYPIKDYRDFFFVGTTIVQGPVSVQDFVKHLSEGTKLSIKEKLFYFILRAYNLGDDEVQSMFHDNQMLGWTKDCLDLFDKATTILDKEKRCEFTCNELVPALFDILHEVVKVKKEELMNCVPDSQSLLDDDKLREAEYDENDSPKNQSNSNPDDSFNNENESDSDEGNPESDKPEDEECEEKDCGGESSEGSAEDSSSSSSDSDECSGESDDTEHDEDYERSWGPEEDEEDSSGSDSDSKADSSESKTTHDQDAQSSAAQKTPDGKSLEECLEKMEKDFEREIDQASKELNESIDEGKTRSYNNDVSECISENANELSANDVVDLLNGVEKKEPKSLLDMKKNTDSQNNCSTFSSKAQSLYNTASTLFKRIYNFDTDELSYLDNGELDENIMVDFYTEKSINIFSQKLDLVESKKIKIIFMIDDSGSMDGGRRNNCITVVPPLIHAFEDSGIQCSLYTFGSNCYLLKDFDDPVVLVDNQKSNIRNIMASTYDGCSTDITPALMSLAKRNYPNDDDIVYVLFVFTDGGFDDTNTASALFKYLREEMKFNLFGVTIDQPEGVDNLKYCMFQREDNDYVHDYSTDELLTKLPQDIYTTIVDEFIRKH